MKHPLYTYHDDRMTFSSKTAGSCRTLYFPLCGPTENHLKSAVTPYLCGDIKLDKDCYITPPVSREDLRRPLRNVFVATENGHCAMADANSHSASLTVEAGQIWHQVTRTFAETALSVAVLNFCPVRDDCVELMRVQITNEATNAQRIVPTVVIPIFARALANKHDHEHVTSLLNRIEQVREGVVVCPTMKFNEEGHLANERIYFVFGGDSNGESIRGSFPTLPSFCGEQGDLERPEAVLSNRQPVPLDDKHLQGNEAVGALQFQPVTLEPGQTKTYIIATGISSTYDAALEAFRKFNSNNSLKQALTEVKQFWAAKTDSITVETGDADYDAWMRWVVLQPVLRRIFGCSFLPDHDYGKGGKGWRDIWQDLLSLILIEPEQVRDNLLNNFGGVRIDGSNATIIGARPGEFIADRNKISRVWMDHGVWPLLTLSLYLHQTGDFDILLEDQPYFKDHQLSRNIRATASDRSTTEESVQRANKLRDYEASVYLGTVLEHLLVQALVQFFNVGEHNLTRLENADWNDGLDMAFERGESVTFSSIYAGNLLQLASILEALATHKSLESITVAKELVILLDTLGDSIDYADADAKRKLLFKRYFPAVEPDVSGKTQEIEISAIVKDLRLKGQSIFDHIRQQEKITAGGYTWFNGYYDNQGQRVEGVVEGITRMTLTGQVFPVMSGLAKENEIEQVIAAVNQHLRDDQLGGYRLNTDFQRPRYLELGRAFGFAYGTKENGAFFSHMTVMYAYALYKQGFAHEGYTVLNSIYAMSMDTDKSWIYPGVPEYFDSLGRGMYHYLTGSASWYVLTVLTQMFGVAGEYGRLRLQPKLVRGQFDTMGRAAVRCNFAGKKIMVEYINKQQLDYGEYQVHNVLINGQPVVDLEVAEDVVCLERPLIDKTKTNVQITLKLGPRV